MILHEEAEDGNAMPDLSRPVQAVSHAVADLVKVVNNTFAEQKPLTFHIRKNNLMNVFSLMPFFAQVGRETINSSDDPILKQDMPAALHRVEGASKLLEEASGMLKGDPYSGPARYVVKSTQAKITGIIICIIICMYHSFIGFPGRSLLKAPEVFFKERLHCCCALMNLKFAKL